MYTVKFVENQEDNYVEYWTLTAPTEHEANEANDLFVGMLGRLNYWGEGEAHIDIVADGDGAVINWTVEKFDFETETLDEIVDWFTWEIETFPMLCYGPEAGYEVNMNLGGVKKTVEAGPGRDYAWQWYTDRFDERAALYED